LPDPSNAAAPDLGAQGGSEDQFAADKTIVLPASATAKDRENHDDEAPRVPLWLARGYRLAPPGPTTEEERSRAAIAARARASAWSDHHNASRALDTILGGVS